MPSDDPRILVIGAGVNGSIIADRLFAHGTDATILARGHRLSEIEANGIVIENPFSHQHRIARIRAIGELAPGDIYDYILVVVRRNQVAGLLPALAANASPTVVFMNNNLNGPAELVAALGSQRPMLGFVFGGGKRDGDLIRAIGPFKHSLMRTPFGEIDGKITPRLTRLVALLNQAGLRSKVSTQIVDYLATHAAGVAALALMGLKHGSDVRALAHSREDLRLMAAATRETIPVLEALGHKIVPAKTRIVAVMPLWLLAGLFRLFLSSRIGEYGASWHLQQAPDEMLALAADMRAAVQRSGLPVPALRKVLEMD
jgi:2-dehydropantoate 2-reductase